MFLQLSSVSLIEDPMAEGLRAIMHEPTLFHLKLMLPKEGTSALEACRSILTCTFMHKAGSVIFLFSSL